MTNHSWKDRFLVSLKEQLTIKDIQKLRNVSAKTAMTIRDNAIEYLSSQNPDYCAPAVRIDTDAVFKVTGHDCEYYKKKMKEERMALEIEKE